MKDEIEESKKIMKDWFKQYYEKPEKVTSFMLDQEDRIKELEQINEEHRKINGELREIINEAIEYIEKYSSISGYYFNSKYNRENDCLDVKERLLNILQGSDE